MKDLVEKILLYLPNYFLDVGRLFAAPKSFFAKRDVASDAEFLAAVTFAAIATVILFVLELQFGSEEGELWSRLAIRCVLRAVAICLLAVGILAGWRLVGWKNAAKPVFTVSIYFSTMMSFIAVLFLLVAVGTLRTFAPGFFAEFRELQKELQGNTVQSVSHYVLTFGERPDAGILIFAGSMIVLGVVVGFVWLLAGWGIFRKLNGLPRWKSAVAFAIAVAIFVPSSAVVEMVRMATAGKVE